MSPYVAANRNHFLICNILIPKYILIKSIFTSLFFPTSFLNEGGVITNVINIKNGVFKE